MAVLQRRSPSSGSSSSDRYLSRVFDLTRSRTPGPHVDDQTWYDLEFPKLLRRLNRTVTTPGGQHLYQRLRTYDFDASGLNSRYRAYQYLRADKSLSERLQYILLRLDVDDADYMADTILGRPPERPSHFGALTAWSIFSLIGLVALPVLFHMPWLCLGILAINAIILLRLGPTLERDIDSLLACQRMLAVADRLSKFAESSAMDSIPQLGIFITQGPLRKHMRRQLLVLSLLSLDTSFGGLLFLLANLCFIAKVIAYGRTVERFKASRDDWALVLNAVGDLDTSIAIASYLDEVPDHCQPDVSDERSLSFADVYHPLLNSPVKNDLLLLERSALITGSNMAGKTTFIKTAAINIIFGHTLGICCATAATIPRSTVMSAIRTDQSVESGKSRYFIEAESIKAFEDAAVAGVCRFFVIDELFSGTNPLERMALAKAVLEHLSAYAQVLVTTHDVELQFLLPTQFSLYHFQEDPDVQGFFDYKIREGVCNRRNAIRILERIGLPPQVVREAFRLAEELRHRGHYSEASLK